MDKHAQGVLWLCRFSPASAKCRLPYTFEENRPLFTALFRYMQVLLLLTCLHTHALAKGRQEHCKCCVCETAVIPDSALPRMPAGWQAGRDTRVLGQ